MACGRRSWCGVLLACWLSFGASGDDCNFLRIAAPFLPLESLEDTFPLDDPNTDFTGSDDSGGVLVSRAQSLGGDRVPRTPVARSLLPTPSAPPLLPPLAAGVRVPLRC
jgi:hypothetical protein